MRPETLVGDCRVVLRMLPPDSIHCAVTSPPYYGLRAYDTEPQVWGGEPVCRCRQCGVIISIGGIEKGEPNREWQERCGADRSGGYQGQATKDYQPHRAQDPSAVKARILAGMRERRTVGWRPTCQCPEHHPIPCTILDPFGGSGTTGLVATELSRRAILIELNPLYAEQAATRNAQSGLELLASR